MIAEAPTIFVATPMYAGMVTASYAVSLMRTPATLASHGYGLIYHYVTNDSLVPSARNTLADVFLDSPATHLMWIDADIGFDPEDIVSMVQADKEIICGLYARKEILWDRVARAVEDGVPPSELARYATTAAYADMPGHVGEPVGREPYEIATGGTGFMLVKRRVFELLSDRVPTYVRRARVPDQKRIAEFYAISIDALSGDVMLGEDYHFCKLARMNGVVVYAAPWVRLSHTGTYTFGSTPDYR